MTSLETELHF